MIERIWSGSSLVYLLLLPLSWLYGLVSGLIRLSYRCGLRKSWRAPVPKSHRRRQWQNPGGDLAG